MTDTTWVSLFPEGREIFYEGDDPERFRQQIKTEFGIDVAGDPCQPVGEDFAPPFSKHSWTRPGWTEEMGWRFWCPPEHLDAIYGDTRFPMGS